MGSSPWDISRRVLLGLYCKGEDIGGMPTTIDQIEFDFTDTYLVSGIRKQGKSFFVRRFLTPILERQGKVKYWPNPQEVGHLRAHMHHIIDDFDQVPLKKIPDLVDAIQDLSLTGRHRGSGLTIVCHHPAWASKEFRLTPDHIIAFRQPKGESWYDPFFPRDALETLPRLQKHWFLYYGPRGTFMATLKDDGRTVKLAGAALTGTAGSPTPPSPAEDQRQTVLHQGKVR